jgi:hypothetical protein
MGERPPLRATPCTDVPQLVSARFLSRLKLDTAPNPISRRILLRRWRLDSDARATLGRHVDDAFRTAVTYAVRRSVPSPHITDHALAALGRLYEHSTDSQRWECAGSPSSVVAQTARPPMPGSLPLSETDHRAHPARRTQEEDDSNTQRPVSWQGDRRSATLPRRIEPPRDDELHYPRRPGSSRRGARWRLTTAQRSTTEATPRVVNRGKWALAPPKQPDVNPRTRAVQSARAGPIQGMKDRKRSHVTASYLGKKGDHHSGDRRNLFRRVAEANRRAARSPLDALHMDRFWPPRGQMVRTLLLETGPPHNRGSRQLGHGPPSPPMRRVA